MRFAPLLVFLVFQLFTASAFTVYIQLDNETYRRGAKLVGNKKKDSGNSKKEFTSKPFVMATLETTDDDGKTLSNVSQQTESSIFVRLTDDGMPFTKMNLEQRTVFYSEIATMAGPYVRAKLARRGDMVVTFASNNISNQLLDTTTLCGRTVSVYCPSLTATNTGVIYNYPIETPEKDIFENDLGVPVKKVRRIHVQKGDMLKPTTTMEVTFAESRPLSLRIAGNDFDVAQYFPPPRRCKRCWRLGHTSRQCTVQIPADNICCKDCGSVHKATKECNRPKKCINCEGAHASDSVNCPKYKQRKEALKMSITDNIPVKLALERMSNKQQQIIKESSSIKAASHSSWPALPSQQNTIDQLQKDFSDLKMVTASISTIQKQVSSLQQNERIHDDKINHLETRVQKTENFQGEILHVTKMIMNKLDNITPKQHKKKRKEPPPDDTSSSQEDASMSDSDFKDDQSMPQNTSSPRSPTQELSPSSAKQKHIKKKKQLSNQ
jgi:hypothetical protein